MSGFPRIMHTLQKMMRVRNCVLKKKVDECVIAWEYIPLLSYVRDHPMCTQKEIADELSKTPAAITVATQKLENLGLIQKNIDNDNLRVKRLCITEDGEKTVLGSVSIFDDIDNMMRSGIDEEELKIFFKVLNTMYENLLTGSQMDEPDIKPWD